MLDKIELFGYKKLYGLEDIGSKALAKIEQGGRIATYPNDAIVFRPEKACTDFFWFLEGSLRVRLIAENGQEITLYRVKSGQTCVLTTACLLSLQTYSADAIVEEDITAIAIPQNLFHELLISSHEFQNIVFQTFSGRIAGLISGFAEMAFARQPTHKTRSTA